ncbi:sulfatase-like hydrolase/transferase [Psychrosphaera algicola]|uniref:Sulfatase-like hydrolase/transferase n=1 Tax=Psychrosphaera algicola TaxID=3023714 RepID=A0ABT5FCY6_9GAMM|nr:sulfatase-like hydrolase/transferase [Psychrosphaera sp. G1-22]MDC2888994.1 sulfatase-like hydrolase/transferase [Psychrosphaera sp. G1-22]
MKILSAILILWFTVMSYGSSATQRPNVVLIFADDLGMGMLSRYGQKIITTPNIDLLAQEGIEFTNYHANTYCAPARWSLLNGLHDGRIGAGPHSKGGFIVKLDRNTPKLSDEQWQRQYDKHIQKLNAKARIDDDTLFLAQVAKDVGYRTAQFGKLDTGFLTWHERVTRHGWDHYVGYYDHARAHGFYPSYLWKNGNKLPLKGNPYANAGKRSESGKEPVGTGGETYSQNVLLNEMLSFMRDHKKTIKTNRFFFITARSCHTVLLRLINYTLIISIGKI